MQQCQLEPVQHQDLSRELAEDLLKNPLLTGVQDVLIGGTTAWAIAKGVKIYKGKKLGDSTEMNAEVKKTSTKILSKLYTK